MLKADKYCLNGTITEGDYTVLSTNRSFRYGDGLFETIKLLQGRPLFYRSHYSRLVRGLDALQIQIPEDFTLHYFYRSLNELAKNGNIKNGMLRIQAWRSGEGVYLPKENNFHWLIELFKDENDESFFQESNEMLHLGLFTKELKNVSTFSEFKTANALVYILAAHAAQKQQVDNVLILNRDENVVETIAENIFIYSHGVVKSPPVSDGCVNGIMRNVLKKIFLWNRIEFQETSITVHDVEAAQEVFLSNAIRGIVPVGQFKNKHYFNAFSNGLQIKLNERVAQLIERMPN